MTRSTRFWGQAPQREYTARRLCPGPNGGEPHATRWWRWVDPDRRDGHWHCCTCSWRPPEVSPVDDQPTETAVTKLLPHGEVATPLALLPARELAAAA